MKSCCEKSIKRYIHRSRDVATCDACKNLLLAYANPRDFEQTLKTLEEQGVAFETAERGRLHVVSKVRTKRP
ncbi:MAG TPA: hypothetical protein VIU33_07425 [Nitrospiria bacterium]